VKILLEENLPESLLVALQQLGHQADSVNRLRLKGVDNGALYRQVAQSYDLCFTRDAGFTHNIRQMGQGSPVKVLRVVIPQQRVRVFVDAFIDAFQRSTGHAIEMVLAGRKLLCENVRTAAGLWLCFLGNLRTHDFNLKEKVKGRARDLWIVKR